MNRIRPLSTDDLPAVAALHERVMRSGATTPPPRLASYFARTLLDDPWADPDIPSLVCEGDGREIVGFIGSTVRRLRFDGRPIRLACSGPLVTSPEARSKAVGAFLLRRYLNGPQDVTITDSATDAVRRIWEGLGGGTLHLSCVRWVRMFRPALCIGGHLLDRVHSQRAQSAVRPVLRAVDAVVTRIPGTPFRTIPSETAAEPLTPAALVEHLPFAASSLRLYPDYDESFLEWLFREMREVRTKGELTAMLVRNADRQVVGWYVSFLRADGLSQVLQIAASGHATGSVIDHLFHHARTAGAAGLVGRLEPRLVAPLATRGCTLHNTGTAFALIHSRVEGLTEAVRSGQALLTRMEGETCFGHQTESFEDGAPPSSLRSGSVRTRRG